MPNKNFRMAKGDPSKKLLEITVPHQRYYAYFGAKCMDVFYISNRILKDIEDTVNKGTFSEHEAFEFREEVSKVNKLAKEIHLSILNDPKKAIFP